MTPRISITAISDQQEGSSIVCALTDQHMQGIRHRAWDYFQQRGQTLGNDWDDWLRAERELLWMPHAEMFENSFAIVVRVAVPGLDPKSIQVTATPQSLLIQGTEPHRHLGLEARMHFCEFGQSLFRRFDLPTRIDPATVAATLDKGILEILAGLKKTDDSNTIVCPTVE